MAFSTHREGLTSGGGAAASVSYSRLGSGTTTHSGTINSFDDLLVSGGFEVNGSAAFDGILSINNVSYTFPSADGSSNQFLRTNGSGTLTWATAGVSSNSLDFDEFVNTMLLDANLTINRGGFFLGLGQTPSTVFEVQGTASASYLLTGNTLQVGGYASTAYSRFGTNTTGHSNYITTSNDLLVSGDLEVDGSISAQFASSSQMFITNTTASASLSFRGNGSGGANQSAFSIGVGNGTERLNIFNNDRSPIVTIASSGNVGIGQTAPVDKLHISSASQAKLRFTFDTTGHTATDGFAINAESTTADFILYETGNMRFATSDAVKMTIFDNGNVTIAGNCSDAAGGGGCTADYAEVYHRDVNDLMEATDLLALNPANGKVTKASAAYPNIIGIFSSSPGSLIGQRANSIQLGVGKGVMDDLDPDEIPVALVGRVVVKVSEENGPIMTGDRLTISATLPGYAMRMTEPGQSIGIALEASSGTDGKILTFVNLGYWVPSIDSLASLGVDDSTVNGNLIFAAVTGMFKEAFNVVFENGIIKVARGIFEEIETKFIKSDYAEINKGITIYDEITNQPYCLKIQNGTTLTLSGKCSDQNPSPTPTPSTAPESTPMPEATPEPEPTQNPEQSPESAPESISESTPELSPEPILETTPTPEPI